MDEREDVKLFTNTQKRNTLGGVKIFINALVSLIFAAAIILSSIFLFGGIGVKLADRLFWIQKIIHGIATFLLMISISNITEEIARKRDKDLGDRLIALDSHYQDIMRLYETDKLETFLTNINKANKYNAYIAKLKRKLKHARFKSTKERLKGKLTVDIDELWNSAARVRYYKVTYNQMVSGAFDVSAHDDEYDLCVHKARYGAKKFGTKFISIVAFGGLVSDFMYSYQDFTRDMIVPLIFKVATILLAVYSGVCFGYFIIERTKAVTKGKLRIFSKFRSRINNAELNDENRFLVPVEKDIVVEKIKALRATEAEKPVQAEKNVLAKTFDDTFGNHQPVKVSGFLKKLVENAIEKQQ